MATKLNLVTLLLSAFAARHLEIYKDDPEMLPLFQDLTETDITVKDVVKQEDGTYSGVIQSTSRGFETPTQKWAPADLQSPNTFELANEELYPTLEEALNQTTPGVYAYLGGDGNALHALVVAEEADFPAAVQAALKYDVQPEDVVLPSSDLPANLTLETPYLTGTIPFGIVKSAMRMLPEGSIMQLGAK